MREDELDQFLDALRERIKAACREAYLSKEDKLTANEHRERIHWLRDLKVITRSERDILLAEVANSDSIGFFRRSA